MIWLNNMIARLLPVVPRSLVGIVARQYVAGETLSHAVDKIKALNKRGIGATIDLLGEDPENRNECLKAVEVYTSAIREIYVQGLDSGVSLKPSHMGLKLDKAFCLDNITTLVRAAARNNIFVRIDMEDISLKPDTIDLFLKLKKEYANVGIVLQAYVRKGFEDADLMIAHGAGVRLCKGAYYWEDKKDVYKDMDIINSSYVYLLEKLLSNGCHAGIATHDEKIVFEAMKLIDKMGIPKEQYEFQMLYGVDDELRDLIAAQGHPVRIYVPFGREWFAYSIRRLKENPKMVNYIISNFIRKLFSR